MEQVTAFGGAMYEHDDVLEIRRLPVRRGQRVSLWLRAAVLSAAVPALLVDNASGLDVYIGANPRTGSGQRTAGGVSVSLAMMLDFDHVDNLDLVRARLAAVTIEHDGEQAVLPPPTAIVASGHGYWVWWRLAEATRELYVRTVALDVLAEQTGSDPSVSDPARIARLPGFTNWKPPVAPGLAYG